MKKKLNTQLLLVVMALFSAGMFTGCVARTTAPACLTLPTSQTTSTTPITRSTVPELQRLQGTWQGAMVGEDTNRKITITINGDSLHFHRDTNFWFETTFTLPAGKDPQELHATIKDCPAPKDPVGKVVIALFKIEDGVMTLAATGDDDPDAARSFETPGLTRYELRKAQP